MDRGDLLCRMADNRTAKVTEKSLKVHYLQMDRDGVTQHLKQHVVCTCIDELKCIHGTLKNGKGGKFISNNRK